MILCNKHIFINLFFICMSFINSIKTQQESSNGNNLTHVNILLLLPTNDTYKFSMSKVLASLNLAIEDLKNTDYGSKFTIDIITDKCDCSGITAPLNAMKNIYKNSNQAMRFQAVFGPMCDYSLAPIARYAPFWDVAVITTNALAQDFRKNKFTEYKTLTNIGPTMYWLDKFVTKLFKRFDWKQTIFIFDKDYQEQITNSNCFFTMGSLKAALFNSNITVEYKTKDKQDTRPIEVILKDYIGNKFSVVCLCGSTKFVNEIMLAAQKLGFMNGEYVFINFDLYAQMHSEERLIKPWLTVRDDSKKRDQDSISNEILSYQGLLTVTLKIDDSNGKYRAFQKKLHSFTGNMFKNEREVNYFLASFYDAMHIYIKALSEIVANKNSINNIPEVLKKIWNKNFDGVTGHIVIDNYGDRMAEYSLYDMNPNTLEFEQVITSAKSINNTDLILEYNEEIRPIYWHSQKSGNFSDSPECGYNKAKCPVKEPLPFWAWLLTAMGLIMIIMAVLGIILFRKSQFEAQLNAMNWLIKWEDVSASMSEKNEKSNLNNKKNKKSLMNNRHETIDATTEGENVSLASVELKTTNAKTVVYKRNWCYIKKINKTKIEITRALLLEVKKIKDLQNDHITRFIGICLEPNRQFIFNEYCQKGSLQDLLENQEIELESSFKNHLMHDIIKGMLFIHSSEIKCHGNLTSANCVVDSRFTLKISDFGLTILQAPTFTSSEQFYKKQLWRAPELQSSYIGFNPNTASQLFVGTQKGDIYSFAIIVQEILYRKGVFYVNDEDRENTFKVNENYERNQTSNHIQVTYQELFTHVKLGLRPSIDEDICSKEINDLLKKCWSETISERPDFHVISHVTRKTTKISGNILDNLLARMEKYANNLEDIVKERTEACENERKRAEQLLYRLLPPTVATQLMQGNDVKAESFNYVTIYFSDICGFTDLSGKSTPMQVVHLLNGLYTLFDSIIENYDVYKVETIGDAYMVVSGLPQRNQNHACEIARMSLALLENVEHFKIPHFPEKKLELRIGLHTGSCVAGVVGLKMPRYCLFGDTVNTASRMESNGKPLRIHISPQTKESLDRYGTFNIKLRGPVEMKGKGVITTYWLMGENGKIIDQHTD